MDHVFHEIYFCFAAFIFDLFSMLKNDKTSLLWGNVNLHVVQLLKMAHVAYFWNMAFTYWKYCAAKKFLAHSTSFWKQTTCFLLNNENFKNHNFVLQHLKNVKPVSAPTIWPFSSILLNKNRGSELRLSL